MGRSYLVSPERLGRSNLNDGLWDNKRLSSRVPTYRRHGANSGRCTEALQQEGNVPFGPTCHLGPALGRRPGHYAHSEAPSTP